MERGESCSEQSSYKVRLVCRFHTLREWYGQGGVTRDLESAVLVLQIHLHSNACVTENCWKATLGLVGPDAMVTLRKEVGSAWLLGRTLYFVSKVCTTPLTRPTDVLDS